MTVEEVDRLTELRMRREALTDNTEALLSSLLETLRGATRKKELSTEELIRQKREAAQKKKNQISP